MSVELQLGDLIADPKIATIVCCGSGGVGKTTTAAALGVLAAEAGRTVVVLTIDPAKRLAHSLGLDELDNTPRQVGTVGAEAGGRLDAMMLDMKRTFDEVVEAGARSDPERAQAILNNPFYITLSSSFAGTSEYMAMEKLGQLRTAAAKGEAGWDLIIVDTPPSRSALDFLDAPARLSSFLDGKFIRLLMAPARKGGRLYVRALTGAVGGVAGVLSKVLGSALVADVQTFVAATDTMFGGFRERAQATYAALKADGTAFVVVAAPDHDSLREAGFFVARLDQDRMPLAGVLVNRVTPAGADLTAADAEAAAKTLTAENKVTKALLTLHARRARRRERELVQIEQFAQAHPDVPLRSVPALATDVHDLEGLRAVGAQLG